VIALHGLHHAYHPDPPNTRALVRFHKRGEFVGLALEEQRQILASSLAIFRHQGVKPTMFMAPSHSFDHTTLEALLLESDIRWITDGISYRPFSRWRFNWLPQQIWDFRSWLPFGVWTVCLHPNTMSEGGLSALADATRRNRAAIVDAPLTDVTPHGIVDDVFALLYWVRLRMRAFSASLLTKR
jgi:hypothetical protein